MTEPLSSEGLALGRQINALANAGVRPRDPDAVVQAVVRRPARSGWMRLPLRVAVAAGAFVLVAVVAVGSLAQMGSSPATAHLGGITIAGIDIGGTTYGVGVARSIDLSDVRLTAVGEVRRNGAFRTQGSTAYQVNDIDPQKVLVMKLVPGERDDAGSIGDYLVLIRGNGYSLLCPYFHRGDPLAPTDCR
jgi:hypothetical protein